MPSRKNSDGVLDPMANLSDAVAQIQAADLPVLVLDTCSLVDPIRAPLRPADLKDCIEASQELLQLVTVAPRRCTLVIASFIHGEWLTHAGRRRTNFVWQP